jgi:hypothetical protein
MSGLPDRGKLALAGLLALCAAAALGFGCGDNSSTSGTETTMGGVPRGREEQRAFRTHPQNPAESDTTTVEPSP